MSSNARIAFLICPIKEPGSPENRQSRALLEKIIEPALRPFGFRTEHFLDPDHSDGQDGMRQRMLRFISSAEICIADLTGNNPNVFFEYGLRRAAGLPVLAFIQKGQKLLFDIDDYYTAPYDLERPQAAIRAIEDFMRSKGFGAPHVQLSPQRKSQTNLICEHIRKNKPRRINVLHLSFGTLVHDFLDALRKSPDVIVCLLLMHPVEAARYALGAVHSHDVLGTEQRLRQQHIAAKTYQFPLPTIGLWYYRHEPSIAALFMDENFLQLGWYFREPVPGAPDKLRIKGHSQPGLLIEGDDAVDILPKIQGHFNAVWNGAEPAADDCFIGPKKDELRSEWEALKVQ